MKPTLILLTVLLLTVSGLLAADLCVVNGDFSDLSGLKPHGGHGWHEGVPAGWKATAAFPRYAVHAGADGKQPACKVSVLGWETKWAVEHGISFAPQWRRCRKRRTRTGV